MSYHPRIESSEIASFCTTRTRNSELWFINNFQLEQDILAYTAKYSEIYNVDLYAIAIEGNHHHELAHFPNSNRASFMRDLNASIARAVSRRCGQFPGSNLFARRYSNEFTPGADDIEEYFFYTVLQPVKDGLVRHIKDYPGYNCFYDSIRGIVRKFKVVKWKDYNEKKRWSHDVRIEDYTYTVQLKFKRLPGYESLTQNEYEKLMIQKLEVRIREIVQSRMSNGVGFVGRDKLLKKQPGSLPKNTKQSNFNKKRPRILSICSVRWAKFVDWYFKIYFAFKNASEQYRNGNLNAEFPPGTYRPVLFVAK